MTTLHLRKSIGRSPLQRGFLLLALACFALSPTARAVSPAPDGGYSNANTAEGTDALFSLTTGTGNTAIGFETLHANTTSGYNTAIGFHALFNNTSTSNQSGQFNTATGYQALFSNTTGGGNTAIGLQALYSNTTGGGNTAVGIGSLFYNTTGNENSAVGNEALSNNTSGSYNTGTGINALFDNTNGDENTANGFAALGANMTGRRNTASGSTALFQNTTGTGNTASGYAALFSNGTGNNNIALGYLAGQNLTTGSNNIDIGANVLGKAGEANTIRIGTQGTQESTFIAGIARTPVNGSEVIVSVTGKLGVATSSARFKQAIKPMDKASEAILALKPVSFRYKEEIDPEGIPQFGLIAEEVEKISPDLVTHADDGKPYTVRYEAVNAMLLNEFLKEHRTVQDLKKEVAALTATVKEQASQIKKVSAQLEVSRPAPQIVADNQ
jgi:hypothetical protein